MCVFVSVSECVQTLSFLQDLCPYPMALNTSRLKVQILSTFPYHIHIDINKILTLWGQAV